MNSKSWPTKPGPRFAPKRPTARRPAKPVPTVSANVTTETRARRAPPDPQARQVWTVNQETPASPEPRANRAAATADISRPRNRAENAHRARPDRKDPPDQLAKPVTKANRVTTEVWAKTEASDQPARPDQPATPAQTASPAASDQPEKTESPAPRESEDRPEARAKTAQPATKDPTDRTDTQDQPDQPEARDQKDKMAAPDPKVRPANRAQPVVRARTLNIARARVEAIKHHHLRLLLKNFVSQLLQCRFQISVMLVCKTVNQIKR